MYLSWLTGSLLIRDITAQSDPTSTAKLNATRTGPFPPIGSEPDLDALAYKTHKPIWLEHDAPQAVVTVNVQRHAMPVDVFSGRERSVSSRTLFGTGSDSLNAQAQPTDKYVIPKAGASAKHQASIIPATAQFHEKSFPVSTDVPTTGKEATTSKTIVMIVKQPNRVDATATQAVYPIKTKFEARTGTPLSPQDITRSFCASTRPSAAMRRTIEPHCPLTMLPKTASTSYKRAKWTSSVMT